MLIYLFDSTTFALLLEFSFIERTRVVDWKNVCIVGIEIKYIENKK